MENNKHSLNNRSEFLFKAWTTVGIFSLAIISLLLIKTLFSVFLLVLAGILIAVYFHGFAEVLDKKLKIPTKASVIVSVLFNILILVLFFWFIGARLEQQITELSDTLPKTLQNLEQSMKEYPMGTKILDNLNTTNLSDNTVSTAKKFFSSTFGVASDLYIIILIGLFFTANPSVYKRGLLHLMPPKAKSKTDSVLTEIHDVLKNWIKGQLIGFTFIAILTGLGLWIIGIPLILTLALLAGLSNFVPNFGPVIALIPAFLLALMQDTTTALLVVGLYTFIQLVQSAVTDPIIQNKMVNIPPAVVIFGQVAMGILCGFWGVLLATPFLAILITVINKVYVERQTVSTTEES